MLNYVIFFDMDHMHTGFPMHLVTNLVVNSVIHLILWQICDEFGKSPNFVRILAMNLVQNGHHI